MESIEFKELFSLRQCIQIHELFFAAVWAQLQVKAERMWNLVNQKKNKQKDDEYILIRDSSGAWDLYFLFPWLTSSEVLECRGSLWPKLDDK